MSVLKIIDGDAHKQLLLLLNHVIDVVKQSDTYKDICKDYDIDINFIDCVPMCFAQMPVSARTENGIIYFNIKLLERQDEIEHYMIHEFNHVLQQCLGKGPTKAVDKSNYLDDKNEQESFKYQTDYIAETDGDNAADKYVTQVLEHHDIPDSDRNKRKKQLLSYNKIIQKQAKFLKQENFVDRLISWIRDRLASYILGETIKILQSTKSRVEHFEFEKLYHECLRYVSKPNNERSICISVDLDNFIISHYFDEFIGKNKLYKSHKDALGVLFNMYGWPEQIPLCVNFIPIETEKDYTGAWISERFTTQSLEEGSDESKHINIPINTFRILNSNDPVATFKYYIMLIGTTVRHEIHHLLQEIFRDLSGQEYTEEIPEDIDPSLGGDLLSFEFYPRLQDGIEYFNYIKPKLPLSAVNIVGKVFVGFSEDMYEMNRILYDALNPQARDDTWEISKETGKPVMDVMFEKYYPYIVNNFSTFFSNLRIHDQYKWKNAVRKFVEATNISI